MCQRYSLTTQDFKDSGDITVNLFFHGGFLNTESSHLLRGQESGQKGKVMLIKIL